MHAGLFTSSRIKALGSMRLHLECIVFLHTEGLEVYGLRSRVTASCVVGDGRDGGDIHVCCELAAMPRSVVKLAD